MSGLEVAGLVLGVIPLALKAFSEYRKIAPALRNARFETKINRVITNLETERCILHNTVEHLLQGLGLSSLDISRMMSDYSDPLWEAQKKNPKLTIRLWGCSAAFEADMKNMKDAIEELQELLGMDGQGQVLCLERGSFSRELKQKIRNVFEIESYDRILGHLKDGNSRLSTMISGNKELEGYRTIRSQIRLVRIIRRLSKATLNALMSCFDCSCKHTMGIELQRYEEIIFDDDKDENVAKRLDVHVAIGSAKLEPQRAQSPSRDSAIGLNGNLVKNTWDLLSVAVLDPLASPGRTDSAHGYPGHPMSHGTPHSRSLSPAKLINSLSQIFKKKPKKSVKFVADSKMSPMLSISSTAVSAAETLEGSTMSVCTVSSKSSSKSKKLGNLCEEICMGLSIKDSNECYGYVESQEMWDPDARLGVFRRCPPDPPVRLSQVLEENDKEVYEVLEERIKIAAAVATSALQLWETGWYHETVSVDKIMVCVASGRTFAVRDLQDSASRAKAGGANLALLSLGILLVNLLVRWDERVDVDFQTIDLPGSVMAKREGMERLENLRKSCSISLAPGYETACEWCFQKFLDRRGFRYEKFCEEFLSQVVRPLTDESLEMEVL